MAVVTDEILRRVEVLLDILDGEEIGGRDEAHMYGALGGALATHVPCMGCRENRATWGYCPACEDTGLVTARSLSTATHDPYLQAHSTVPRTTLVKNAPPTPAPHREQPVGEHVPLSPVERQVSRSERVYWALVRIRKLLNRAPESVLVGVRERNTTALAWIARRMRFVPSV
jgi:hypothetical protein